MDHQTLAALNTLLFLLIALLQFLFRSKPQRQATQELEERLEEAEKQLESIQRQLLD